MIMKAYDWGCFFLFQCYSKSFSSVFNLFCTLHNNKCTEKFWVTKRYSKQMFKIKDQSLIKQRLVLIFMVIPARVELATYRLGGGCSILLSYGTMSYNSLLYTIIAVLTTAKDACKQGSRQSLLCQSLQALGHSRRHAPFHAHAGGTPQTGQTNLEVF